MPFGEPHKPVRHKLTADEAGMQSPVTTIPGSRLDMSAHPTDFKAWNEAEHPRADNGRFGSKPIIANVDETSTTTEKPRRLNAKLLIGKDAISQDEVINHITAVITKTNKKEIDKMYGEAGGQSYLESSLRIGTRPFTPEANRRIARNVRRVQILGTVEKVQLAKAINKPGVDPTTIKAAAFYSSGTKTVVFGEIRSDHIAHEFAHAVDRFSGPGGMGMYSGKEAWRKIWQEEIVDKAHGGIREYARTNTVEGFACAFELAKENPLSLKTRCPKVYEYLVKKKLLRGDLIS